MGNIRQLLAKKKIPAIVLDQNRGKVFNVFVPQQMRVVLNVYPDKGMLGPLGGQGCELGLPSAAAIAPGGAIAGDHQAVGLALEAGAQRRQIVRIVYSHADRTGPIFDYDTGYKTTRRVSI